jgi:hypothetical protein
MSVDRIRSWLQLPDGVWPPDHYTLLGLKGGEGSPELVEERALERMELLRRYQLSNPDEVTEGMNRLAQALDCLSDPIRRSAYDAKLGLATETLPPPAMEAPPPDPIELEIDEDIPEVPLIEIETLAAPVTEPPPELPPSEPVLPETFRIVEEEPPVAPARREPILLEEAEPPPRRPVVPRPREQRPHREEPQPQPEPKAEHFRLEVDPERAARRQRYAELARLRKVIRVWEDVRGHLTDPERSFNRRTDAIAFMAVLGELRPLLPLVDGLVGGPNEPGGLVAALARQPLVVDTFRFLLPSQRDALAQDCRAAHFALEERYRAIRADLHQMLQKGWGRRVWLPMVRQVGRNPEWGLLILGIFALVIAFLRSIHG